MECYLCVRFQDWLFSTGQAIGVLFPGEEPLPCSQISLVTWTSLFKIGEVFVQLMYRYTLWVGELFLGDRVSQETTCSSGCSNLSTQDSYFIF